MTFKTAIVVTTIFEPAFLPGYLASLEAHGQRERVATYVIGDRKTPASVWEAAAEARRGGFRVECPTLEEQEQYLAARGVPGDFIPWNTDNRRNVGFLMALEAGCEVLISIDDDNFVPPGSDFLGGHAVVGQPAADRIVTGSDGWFNLCSLLTASIAEDFFPRGFPYAAQQTARTLEMHAPGPDDRVAVNAGLWLDDPDVDAVVRLGQRPKISGWKGASVVLGPDTWSPVNTQNTALTREAAFTYWYVRMGYPLRGLTIDRFGDILSGYFTQKCVRHVGQFVRVGTPLVEHRRTVHNLFKDLYHELAGMVLIEDLLPWLREVRLSGSSMQEAYLSLADELQAQADHFTGFIWDDGGREFLKETGRLMQVWSNVVARWA